MRTAASAAVLALLAAPAFAQEASGQASVEGLPAGDYVLDPSHASLVFKVNHLGFSSYTASFSRFDAALTIDPANPGVATLTATIDPTSLTLPSPPDGFLADLLGPAWFDAVQFPEIALRSTEIDLLDDDTAMILGELTLHGVTGPVSFMADFNGGWPGIPQDPHARIGFSATGALSRTAFGMGFGVPEPGSAMGVGDAVLFEIEAEFTGPAWDGAPAE
jgi:polyisoprenoid-binding protein YceI